jgi:hypothetical protein
VSGRRKNASKRKIEELEAMRTQAAMLLCDTIRAARCALWCLGMEEDDKLVPAPARKHKRKEKSNGR